MFPLNQHDTGVFLIEHFYAGRFLNSIASLVLALTALMLGFAIIRSRTNDKMLQYFGAFWIMTGCSWIAITLRTFFSAINKIDLDILFFQIDQGFIITSGIFLAPYLFLSAFKWNGLARLAFFFYVAFAMLGIYTLTLYGVAPTPNGADDFATEYASNKYTLTITMVMMAILFIVTAKDTIWKFFSLQAKKIKWHEFLAPFSILVYLLFGFVDVSGVIGSWMIIIFRLVFLIAFVLAYISFIEKTSENKESKIIVI